MGDLTSDHLLNEHQQLKELLADLNGDSITDPNFDGKLQELMEVRQQQQEQAWLNLICIATVTVVDKSGTSSRQQQRSHILASAT